MIADYIVGMTRVRIGVKYKEIVIFIDIVTKNPENRRYRSLVS